MNNHLHMIFAVALFTTIAVEAADSNEKTVFVTKARFISDLGGLVGADAKCQVEADDPASIVPSGTYLAWLSDGTDSPDTRFKKSSHPYLLSDGTKIAENYTDLTDGSILHVINLGPTGATFGYHKYWTGTKPDGTPMQAFKPNAQKNSCNAWNGTTVYWASAAVGMTHVKSGGWTSNYLSDCRDAGRGRHRLVCFQQ
jgi:hypothetical protein